jgi:hypothetical protein
MKPNKLRDRRERKTHEIANIIRYAATCDFGCVSNADEVAKKIYEKVCT